jgi:cob(I)alamin adenosyltransferase
MWIRGPWLLGKRGLFMAKVTTGTGDTGYTSLLGEQRVPKYHPLPEAFGAVDEATSALGMARAATDDPTVQETILRMQQDLYVLMAELATPPEHQAAVGMRVTPEQVAWLDGLEAHLKQEVEIPNKFIIPGDSAVGAALDLARTIIRRSERLVARLTHEGAVENPDVLRYLNRLSDAVFILARYVEAKAGGSTQAKRSRDE